MATTKVAGDSGGGAKGSRGWSLDQRLLYASVGAESNGQKISFRLFTGNVAVKCPAPFQRPVPHPAPSSRDLALNLRICTSNVHTHTQPRPVEVQRGGRAAIH